MEQIIQQLLLEQLQRYPCLQIEDVLKFLHQSTFGCGHLIDSPAAAAGYLRNEMRTCKKTSDPPIELLGGAFCRVHLHYLRELGISPETFSHLLALSAIAPCGSAETLATRLESTLRLVEKHPFPFSSDQFSDTVEGWRSQGFPALHHSQLFRQTYAPAYRVLTCRHARWLPLLAMIDRLCASKSPVLIAVDGNSGAGKTTLAALLQQVYDCNVFHMDDFFLRPEQRTPQRYAQPGENVDHERFREEVLLPLSQGETVRHRRFDCSTFTLTEPVEAAPKPVNIIEGVYSMHPKLAVFYDFSVFLTVDANTQRERIERRNGAFAQQFFSKWIPLEETYFSALDVAAHCDLVMDVSQSEL